MSDSNSNKFKLHSSFKPTGDQPKAIDQMVDNINKGVTDVVLLGVTGSGKTFTIANLIEKVQRPALVISHNKTLAGQLFQEFREFFPENTVEYFVSYYDYYQPESYLPSTDTYIEKEADKNEEIDRLRLSATTSLSTRDDVVVVSSVSCIYNLGSPAEYAQNILEIAKGMNLRRKDLFLKLTDLQYDRSDYDLRRSTYRVKGDSVDIFPSYEKETIRLNFLEDKLTEILRLDPVSGEILDELDSFTLYPAKHYVTAEERRDDGIKAIKKDLAKRLEQLKKQGKYVEAYRLEQRTNHDIEMIEEIGYCSGIENYSVYFDGRSSGDPPFTLLDYFNDDYLLIIDESHITVPQIGGMYAGDRSRKETLVDYGFRLPSALDNRPLRFDEFQRRMGENTIYTSATPSEWELDSAVSAYQKVDSDFRFSTSDSKSKKDQDGETMFGKYSKVPSVVELVVRPTGLVDPEIEVKPIDNQVNDLINEIEKTVKKKQRVLVTTLTKRMAEDLTRFLQDKGIKVEYLHSDIETLDRSDILDDLRKGTHDVVVGINLLREGLDLPEVSLVAILDADKEGFLRSDKSLIQTMGRTARHVEGRVIMYADKVTGSMQRAIDEVERRREIQISYNKKHDITPQSISKPFREVIIERDKKKGKKDYKADIMKDASDVKADLEMEDFEFKTLSKEEKKDTIKRLESEMKKLAGNLEFEKASVIRDKVKEFKRNL